MKEVTHYDTVSNALAALRSQGYTVDFNLEENGLGCEQGKFSADEFDIMDVYRYEGDSDPADEATVYAIQSSSGIKGVLVTGYGMSDDPISDKMLAKLNRK